MLYPTELRARAGGVSPVRGAETRLDGGRVVWLDAAVDQPPPTLPPRYFEEQRDVEHIKLLVIFHYVYAGLVALGASIPIIHVVVGLTMVSGSFGSGPSAPPPEFGWFFVGIGGLVILIGWTMAVLIFLAGRFMSERRNPTFVFVIACINCINVPMGTALGVMTILVLQRPSVKALFEGQGAALASPYSKA